MCRRDEAFASDTSSEEEGPEATSKTPVEAPSTAAMHGASTSVETPVAAAMQDASTSVDAPSATAMHGAGSQAGQGRAATAAGSRETRTSVESPEASGELHAATASHACSSPWEELQTESAATDNNAVRAQNEKGRVGGDGCNASGLGDMAIGMSGCNKQPEEGAQQAGSDPWQTPGVASGAASAVTSVMQMPLECVHACIDSLQSWLPVAGEQAFPSPHALQYAGGVFGRGDLRRIGPMPPAHRMHACAARERASASRIHVAGPLRRVLGPPASHIPPHSGKHTHSRRMAVEAPPRQHSSEAEVAPEPVSGSPSGHLMQHEGCAAVQGMPHAASAAALGSEAVDADEGAESSQAHVPRGRRARFASTEDRRRDVRSQLAGLKCRAELKQKLQ
jgi:hypothetical protein